MPAWRCWALLHLLQRGTREAWGRCLDHHVQD
ncbi:hypothetical protein E2C01_070525 [Portunus trituberculatus]|uniref:Uncharacterized protein n=1 Tax=Portunus trituberculatus TaxID=210409 RepID=A0A5B7HUD3_PORTR|nr:hypothetical protein [Portunus trituberculatus]